MGIFFFLTQKFELSFVSVCALDIERSTLVLVSCPMTVSYKPFSVLHSSVWASCGFTIQSNAV